MPLAKQGQRVPGSGKKASDESLKLRDLVVDILQSKSPLSLNQLRKEVENLVGTQGAALKQATLALVNFGDITYECRNSRYGVYYATDCINRNGNSEVLVNGKKLLLVDETPYVRHIEAHQLPKLSGPIYQPMDWVLHQLQEV